MNVIFRNHCRLISLVFCLLSGLFFQSCSKGESCVGKAPAFLFRLQDVSQFDVFKRSTFPLKTDSVHIFAISSAGVRSDTMKIMFYTENDPAGTPRTYLSSTQIIQRAVENASQRFLIKYKSTMADTISIVLKNIQNQNCSYIVIDKVMLNKNTLTQNDRFSNAYIITRPF